MRGLAICDSHEIDFARIFGDWIDLSKASLRTIVQQRCGRCGMGWEAKTRSLACPGCGVGLSHRVRV